MSYNLSELYERVADKVPERLAMVAAHRRLTYAELNERANRLAQHLREAGVNPGDHVGLQLQNGVEYIEGMLAAFKLRAIPININYRYVERELEYLFQHADLVALIFHRQFGPRIAAVTPRIATLRHLIEVADDGPAAGVAGAIGYEDALRRAAPASTFGGRGSDDLYIAFTGGTTGLPKGVVWRHEDIFFAAMGGGDATRMEGPISTPEQIAERIPDMAMVHLITPPFMHVSAHWGAFQALFGGGTVVVPKPGSFDAGAVVALAARTHAHVLTLVGDAMVRPILEVIEGQPGVYDLSSLVVLASGGAILSATTKSAIHRLLPNVMVIDGFGSTETGITGSDVRFAGGVGGGARFRMDESTAVLDDNLEPVKPGSGVMGRLARKGHIPAGYYKDPVKSAATFVEKHGVRWVLPGDLAGVDADGTVVLHGRGSLSINTGGEKVFAEEVEASLLAHAAVRDVLVVGLPDERWGQRVAAVVQPRPGVALTLDDIQHHCRALLAGYKVPRALVLVERIQRFPSGKGDYTWAQERALEAAR